MRPLPYIRNRHTSSWFGKFARRAATATGHPLAFLLAVAVIVVWGASGPVFGFSDTWQLVINTGTTIVTFLMVFVIQNATNRDAEAMHLKLDELIRAIPQARTDLLDLEKLDDEQLEELMKDYIKRAEAAREKRNRA